MEWGCQFPRTCPMPKAKNAKQHGVKTAHCRPKWETKLPNMTTKKVRKKKEKSNNKERRCNNGRLGGEEEMTTHTERGK